MRRALELAERAAGWTNPNPMVGAVVVKNDRVIGEGWHTACGKLHAEREALAHCCDDPQGATMYVTLEPCCHWGKTPPCTDALIEAEIARVVVGAPDPNPLVAGKGCKILRDAGIEVVEGVLVEECCAVNHVFFHYIHTARPLVIAKYAMTLDGKIATRTGASRWITSEVARQRVHQDRQRYAAIMVGIGTVLADDPELTCRLEGQKTRNPLRVIVDSRARIPLDSKIVTTAHEVPTLIAVGKDAAQDKLNLLREAGCEIFVTERNPVGKTDVSDKTGEVGEANGAIKASVAARVDLAAVLAHLGQQCSIDSVLAEGGATLLWSLFSQGLVDRVQAYIAPKIFGGADAPSPVQGLGVALPDQAIQCSDPVVTQLGRDLLIECEVMRCSRESLKRSVR